MIAEFFFFQFKPFASREIYSHRKHFFFLLVEISAAFTAESKHHRETLVIISKPKCVDAGCFACLAIMLSMAEATKEQL